MHTADQLTVADLEGDGDVEVIADGAILEGSDGSTVAMIPRVNNANRSPIAADLDQDGIQEIILGSEVYDPTGGRLWAAVAPVVGSIFSAVVDADGDPGGEVVFVTNEGYSLYDEDGTRLLSASLPTPFDELALPGTPCVADFDGDGLSEVVVPAYDVITMLELDGTVVWSRSTRDTGTRGCSAFDFDRDGAAEIVFADLRTFYLLDGSTGTARFAWEDHDAEGGLPQYPVVADVDHDGSAEVVLASVGAGEVRGITVFGHADGAWPSAGPTWGVHDFSETNLGLDGTVPTFPVPPWQEGVFRARPAGDGARPDLTVSFTDACAMDCTFGPVRVAVQVANRGSVDVDAGVALEIWAVDFEGERLATTITLPALPAGQRLEGMEIALDPEDVGTDGFSAVIDPDGRVRECDEANNTDRLAGAYCY